MKTEANPDAHRPANLESAAGNRVEGMDRHPSLAAPDFHSVPWHMGACIPTHEYIQAHTHTHRPLYLGREIFLKLLSEAVCYIAIDKISN